jgi:predicted metal-dependent hydrolase
MGTDDPAERDLYQGLIKLAAAYVHAVRGNPAGVVKNLRGARERLADAIPSGAAVGLDIASLVRAIDAALASRDPTAHAISVPPAGESEREREREQPA